MVMIKVAKPAAVVKFVIKVAVPTFVITRCNALYFHEQHIHLLVRKIQFGIPITITRVGTTVSTVI
jgi:hypothetical protein